MHGKTSNPVTWQWPHPITLLGVLTFTVVSSNRVSVITGLEYEMEWNGGMETGMEEWIYTLAANLCRLNYLMYRWDLLSTAEALCTSWHCPYASMSKQGTVVNSSSGNGYGSESCKARVMEFHECCGQQCEGRTYCSIVSLLVSILVCVPRFSATPTFHNLSTCSSLPELTVLSVTPM